MIGDMENKPIRFEHRKTNGVQLHTALAGPTDGEPVFLLHGFPEAWFGWENQIIALAKAGFRVIAPDQRGYNMSDKPAGVENYRTELLTDDILGLADALELESFNLAGHDWGAMVAWNLAIHAPDRINSLAIVNVPHPLVFKRYLRSHPSQMLKSWYMFFFQLPSVPEWLVQANNWKFFSSVMPDQWNESQFTRYRKAWSQPGASTAMINWYRATFSRSNSSSKSDIIQPPTLIIWGKNDPHLSHQMAPLSLEFCQNGMLVYFEDATHWVQHDKPEEVSQLLIDHFQKD